MRENERDRSIENVELETRTWSTGPRCLWPERFLWSPEGLIWRKGRETSFQCWIPQIGEIIFVDDVAPVIPEESDWWWIRGLRTSEIKKCESGGDG